MYANDGESIEGRTRLQKLVFLMQRRLEENENYPLESTDYDFVPYDYGPFSKELYGDLDALADHKMIESREESLYGDKTKYVYDLKPSGEEFVERQLSQQEAREILELARELKEKYNDILLSDLIEDVYSRYPKYAENSIYWERGFGK